MAEMEGGDEELRQDLLAFGEKVDKITDKNRAILVKKLNHLRARKRQSEKLSASMLESPKRGGAKGRGKKAATAKEVGATVIGTPEELVDKRLSVSLARNDAVVEPVTSYSWSQPQALMVDSHVEDEAAPPVKKGRGGRISTRVTKKTTTAADDQVNEASTDIGSNKVAGTRGRKKPGAGGDGKALNETLVVEVNEVNDERLVKCIDSSSVNVVNNNTVAVKRGRASVAAPRKAAEAVEKPKGRKTIANDVTLPVEDNSALTDGGPSTSMSMVSEIATGRRGSYTVARSSPAGKMKAGIDDHGKTAEEAKAVSRIPTLARVPSKTLTPEVCPSPKLTVHVFDTMLGRPAANVSLTLHYEGKVGTSWTAFGYHVTDSEGRYADFAGSPMKSGTYRLHCDTGAYYHSTNTRCSYPYVDIVFNVTDTSRPTNLQLLLSPYSYTFTQTAA